MCNRVLFLFNCIKCKVGFEIVWMSWKMRGVSSLSRATTQSSSSWRVHGQSIGFHVRKALTECGNELDENAWGIKFELGLGTTKLVLVFG